MGNKHIHPSCIQLNLQFHSYADDRWGDGYDRDAALADTGLQRLLPATGHKGSVGRAPKFPI